MVHGTYVWVEWNKHMWSFLLRILIDIYKVYDLKSSESAFYHFYDLNVYLLILNMKSY